MVSQSYAVAALRNSLRMRFRLGLFDGNTPSPYKNISTAVVGCEEHQEMSLRAARKVGWEIEREKSEPLCIPLSLFFPPLISLFILHFFYCLNLE